MKKALLTFLLSLGLTAFAADKPKPSGPLKAFKGPEGEVIAMVEANEGKQMLVHFKNIGGEIEGQTRLYDFEDLGDGKKSVYFNQKKGSKTSRFYVLTFRSGTWDFFNPAKPTMEFKVSYSEKDSEKMKVEDVLNAYKP